MKNLLALVALVVASIGMWMSWNAGRADAASTTPATEVDLAPLVRRVAALEARSEEGARAVELAPVQAALSREPAAGPEGAVAGAEDLTLRMVRLEEALAELQAREARAAERLLLRRGEPDPAALERAAALARDASAAESVRLEGLRNLRGKQAADGSDARLAVLDDMIALAQTSTDGDTRADVWRQMSHVTDARLKRPLLDALAFDTHEKAREEAAETLADFLPDAQVEAGLRAAAANDASASVRRQAASSLAGGR